MLACYFSEAEPITRAGSIPTKLEQQKTRNRQQDETLSEEMRPKEDASVRYLDTSVRSRAHQLLAHESVPRR